MDESELTQFEMRWNRRAAAAYVSLTPDERRSIVFVTARLAPWQVVRWLARCGQLELFVRDHRRLPRRVEGERSLYDWVRVQRRDRWSLTGYQRERLELVLGVEAWGRADAWERSLYLYEEFLDQRGRAPRRRSADPDEVRLARWWDRNIVRLHDGRLPSSCRAGLVALGKKRARFEQNAGRAGS